MMFWRVASLVLLHLGNASTTAAWSHVSGKELLSMVGSNDFILAAFVLPNTAETLSLEPEWMSAASLSPKVLMSIDCSVEAEFCDKNDVLSYPAIRLFKSGSEAHRYRGSRKAAEITSFLRRARRPILSTLASKNATTFQTIDSTVFIAHVVPSDTDLKSTFTTLASQNHHLYTFATIPSSTTSSLICHNNLSNPPSTHTLTIFTPSILNTFLTTCSTPLIRPYTRRTELSHLQSGKSLLYILDLSDTLSALSAELEPLAREYEEYISFVTVDAEEYSYIAPALGLREGVFPALALQNPANGMVFALEEGRSFGRDEVRAFVADIAEGKRRPSNGVGGGEHDEL